jgi:phosphate transport system substrate-binding protein
MKAVKALTTTLALAAGALLLIGCNQSRREATAPVAPGAAQAIVGAGATFPAPIYTRWAEAYRTQTGVSLNYQAIGSGGGIKQITTGTVDFGASDMPLKPDDLDRDGLYQFPTLMGGLVPVINLPGVQPGQLKLTGALLADIYLGAVKRWTDPKIAALNSGVKLPNLPITPVHRAEGSGSTFLYTTYLTAKSPAWAQKVGANEAVNWPIGLGGKGNSGVAAFVKNTAGAIGYVEFSYAAQTKMTYADVQTHDGAFVAPTSQAFAAAAAGADWSKAPGNYLLLIDQPGAGSWPITGATFILLHRQQSNVAKAKAVLAFFDWAYHSGDAAAGQLAFVPLPDPVKDRVRKQWADTIKGPDGASIYTVPRA